MQTNPVTGVLQEIKKWKSCKGFNFGTLRSLPRTTAYIILNVHTYVH